MSCLGLDLGLGLGLGLGPVLSWSCLGLVLVLVLVLSCVGPGLVFQSFCLTRAMVRAPEPHTKFSARAPRPFHEEEKVEVERQHATNRPSSNLKRNPPQSDSDRGEIPL